MVQRTTSDRVESKFLRFRIRHHRDAYRTYTQIYEVIMTFKGNSATFDIFQLNTNKILSKIVKNHCAKINLY